MRAPITVLTEHGPGEAMRLIPGTDNWKDVCDWLHGSHELAPSHDGEGGVTIGLIHAEPGWWIVVAESTGRLSVQKIPHEGGTGFDTFADTFPEATS